MMHEKGIPSCTTNMKREESWLWTVSWALTQLSHFLTVWPWATYLTSQDRSNEDKGMDIAWWQYNFFKSGSDFK